MERAIFGIILFAALLYGFWRLAIFLRVLFKPARDKIEAAIGPQADAIKNHVDDSLRRTGLGAVADFGAKIGQISRGIDGALDANAKAIEERRK
ncbi:hypothetical protein [Brachymonas sp.]|uniref:hypothetical protein n=1 Tax=Brachymonas sp. TaxID=1936292 RepID=UPI0035B0D477